MCEHLKKIILDGEEVCSDCGEIGSRYIDETSEWNNYDDNKEDKSRIGFTTSDLLNNDFISLSRFLFF